MTIFKLFMNKHVQLVHVYLYTNMYKESEILYDDILMDVH